MAEIWQRRFVAVVQLARRGRGRYAGSPALGGRAWRVPPDLAARISAQFSHFVRTFLRTRVPTIAQLVRKGREAQTSKTKTPALKGSPQRRGVCTRVYTNTPKKPNSALRKVARVRLTSASRSRPTSPAKATTSKSTRSCWCVRSCEGPAGVRYKIIRGALDAAGVNKRKQARSRYGAKREK